VHGSSYPTGPPTPLCREHVVYEWRGCQNRRWTWTTPRDGGGSGTIPRGGHRTKADILDGKSPYTSTRIRIPMLTVPDSSHRRSAIKKDQNLLWLHICYVFEEATSQLDGTCEHSSIISNLYLLRRILLICMYLLLSPSTGDIWRNLGFAVRLYFDMAHRPTEGDEELFDGQLHMLSRTIYCIEWYVCNL
jgi:hypothetical protein